MSHPRIEEVSDSEGPSDPSEVDLDDFADSDIMRRVDPPSTSSSNPPSAAVPQGQSHLLNPSNLPPTQSHGPSPGSMPTAADRTVYAGFQCLYPVYFDAARTRAQGRRVASELAVRNPLAREIANACSRLRLPTLLEPDKTHPKDWANPGRVKVGLRKTYPSGGGGGGGSHPIKNKHHLYVLISEHLRARPTTEDSQGLRVRIAGEMQPDADKPYPRPAVPRGWKMGELLPYMSAAMTGGGVSENLFKDMMKEMQGGGDPMTALMGGGAGGGGGGGGGGGALEDGSSGAGKKKKDKKGKGKA